MERENRALTDPRLEDVPHVVVTHGPVKSLQEAAAARGVSESAIVKTMVVRLSDDDYAFVLVPGDRAIDWAKLRSTLGVNRISLPDAATAFEATGYPRGAITPLGAKRQWPVFADQRMTGHTISLGGGEPGVSITIGADDAISILGATVADLTKPSEPIDPVARYEERKG